MPIDQLPRLQRRLAAWQSRKGTWHVIASVTFVAVIVSCLFCYGGFIVVYGSLGSVYDSAGPFGLILPILTPLLVAPLVTGQLTAMLTVATDLIDELDGARMALEYEVAARKATQVQLERLVVADPLTGVLNRRGFFSAVAGRRARGGDGAVVATVDIDDFKRVNDTHGHPAGDAVLRSVAETFVASSGDGAIVARLGGDEFVACLDRDADLDGIRSALSAVRIDLTNGTPLVVRCSIGFADHEPASSIDASISNADASMYDAKARSRERVAERPLQPAAI